MDELKKALLGIAPGLATALGGPLAGAAVSALANHFGVEPTEQAVSQAVQNASPAELLELKKLELEFAKVTQQGEQAYLTDRASARDRDAKVATSADAPYLNKVIVPVLALIVVVGGGAIMVLSQNADVRMAANSMVMVILGFYFGTTMGKVKDSQALRDAVQTGGK